MPPSRFLPKGSIRRKLLLVFVCAVTLPAALMLGLLSWQERRVEGLMADMVLTRQMESLLSGYLDLCRAHPAAEQPLVKSLLNEEQVGMHGYAFILQGQGPNRGTYILSKDSKRDGENIWETKDAAGHHFIQEMIGLALECPEGQVARSPSYPWRNPDESVTRQKIAFVTYYAPWDWVIGISVYEDDRDILLDRMHQAFLFLLAFVLAGGLVMTVAVLAVGVRVARGITRPLSKVIAAAQVVAQGDLASAEARIRDARVLLDPRLAAPGAGPAQAEAQSLLRGSETGELILAIESMVRNLRSLIGQIQGSSVQLLSTATEIAATSRQQETTLNNLGASTNEIAASVNEISATSRELAETMDRVTGTAAETARLAGSGRSGMREMESNIRELSAASGSVSLKLGAINDKARAINSVMSTITKVTDQTNLLSLNAAIEAEKAGEHGLGFGVVAREIRRLADLTAVAAVDIERMIKEMQSSVASGVMEMDKFTQAMDRGMEQVASIGAQMERIIAQVEELMPQFRSVHDGMKSQSQGAQQINEAMILLTSGTRGTLESLREFNKATAHMHQAMKGLQDQVRTIKVDG